MTVAQRRSAQRVFALSTWRYTSFLLILGSSIVLGLAVVKAPLALLAAVSVVVLFAVPHWLVLLIAMASFGIGNVDLTSLGYEGALGIADAALIVWLIRACVRGLSKRLPLSPRSLWIIAFLGWAWLATVSAGVSITPLLRFTMYGAVAILMVMDSRERSYLTAGLTCLAFIELGRTLPDLRYGFLGAQAADPHQLGFLFLAGFAAVMYSEEYFAAKPRLRAILAILLMTAAALTERRGIWLAALIAFAASLIKTVTWPRLAASVVLIVAIGLAAYQPLTETLSFSPEGPAIRRESIERGLQVASLDPWRGTGWAGVGEALSGIDQTSVNYGPVTEVPFNLYVNVLASLGFPGLFLLLGYLISIADTAMKDDRMVWFVVTAFMVLSLAEMTWFAGSRLTLIFFVFAGLLNKPNRTGEPATLRSAISASPLAQVSVRKPSYRRITERG